MRQTKILLSILTLLSFLLPQTSSAIGLISKPIIIDNGLRGETFQETLKVLNSEENSITFELLAEGDITNWVTFYAPTNLESPITQIQAPAKLYSDITVLITVPTDAANGNYIGKLTIKSAPQIEQDNEGASANVSQKLSQDVLITVTDQENVKLAVSVIPHTFDLKKNETLNIRFIYDNQGNVSLKPNIQIKISKLGDKDKKIQIYNAIFPYPDNLQAVKPGAIYEIPAIEIPTTGWANNKYLAEIEFLHNNQSMLLEDFKFNIGTTGFVLGIKDIKINWYIIGGAILIILIALALVLSKKFRIKKVNV